MFTAQPQPSTFLPVASTAAIDPIHSSKLSSIEESCLASRRPCCLASRHGIIIGAFVFYAIATGAYIPFSRSLEGSVSPRCVSLTNDIYCTASISRSFKRFSTSVSGVDTGATG